MSSETGVRTTSERMGRELDAFFGDRLCFAT